MNESTGMILTPLPTQEEFLEEVRQLCKDWGWDGESDPSFTIGAIVECLIEKGTEISYQSIVQEFHTLRADGETQKAMDPEAWKQKLLG
ncbi:hypothetical protein LCGC14_1887430, partial [marine sediment metagenome]